MGLKRTGKSDDTCSGRRNTMFPRTMTLPDSSNILANSAPWSLFEQTSTQIWMNSEYGIEFFGICLSVHFSFSTCDTFSSFLASSTDIPSRESLIAGAGGLSPSSRRRSPVPFKPLSFSLSLSPTGTERNSGSLASWFNARRWRKRRKNPLSEESRKWSWKFVLTALEGTRFWNEGEEMGECSRVPAGDGVLVMLRRRFASVLRSAIYSREWERTRTE